MDDVDLSATSPTRSLTLFRCLVGLSPIVQRLRNTIEQVAQADFPVLLLGEYETGQEVCARNIHSQSKRAGQPFVSIDLASVLPENVDKHLFGSSRSDGLVDQAGTGSLFVNALHLASPELQIKLLRLVAEHRFERVDTGQSEETRVRIIAAADSHLPKQIDTHAFNSSLYYHLNVLTIVLPALRDRVEDLPLLIEEFLARHASQHNQDNRLQFTDEAIHLLSQYQWPGNLRELANLLQRLLLLADNTLIGVKEIQNEFPPIHTFTDTFDTSTDKPNIQTQAKKSFDLKEHMVKTESMLIQQALEESEWVVARAAKHLCMRRTTLIEKMRKYHISRSPEKNLESS